MRRILLAAVAAGVVLAGAPTAQAEPVRLTVGELDAVTAGRVGNFARGAVGLAATGFAGTLFAGIDAADNDAFDGSVLASPNPTLRGLSTRLFVFAADRGDFALFNAIYFPPE